MNARLLRRVAGSGEGWESWLLQQILLHTDSAAVGTVSSLAKTHPQCPAEMVRAARLRAAYLRLGRADLL